jgi:hypothetical protein
LPNLRGQRYANAAIVYRLDNLSGRFGLHFAGSANAALGDVQQAGSFGLADWWWRDGLGDVKRQICRISWLPDPHIRQPRRNAGPLRFSQVAAVQIGADGDDEIDEFFGVN